MSTVPDIPVFSLASRFACCAPVIGPRRLDDVHDVSHPLVADMPPVGAWITKRLLLRFFSSASAAAGLGGSGIVRRAAAFHGRQPLADCVYLRDVPTADRAICHPALPTDAKNTRPSGRNPAKARCIASSGRTAAMADRTMSSASDFNLWFMKSLHYSLVRSTDIYQALYFTGSDGILSSIRAVKKILSHDCRG